MAIDGPARYARLAVHDRLGLDRDAFGARTAGVPAFDATVRFATALVQDGMSGVTVIVPREPGVLMRARGAAQLAGVSLRAENVGSATITMCFASHSSSETMPAREPHSTRRGGRQRAWRGVVRRAPGVVEHARGLAHEFGLECYADMRGGSIRIRFTP